ncbi:MAG: molecular chaperone TorD family protein [Bradymonadaceae bacterium]
MRHQLADGYRLVSELFVHPARRDRDRLLRLRTRLADAPGEFCDPIDEFHAARQAWSADEYVQTLELAPPCPLYIGSYLYDEPGSCRGAGVSDRNGYLVELTNLYRHFGLEIDRDEMPDFMPIMLEFLALTADVDDDFDASLRRYFVDDHFRPGLEPFHETLSEYESVYRRLVEATQVLVDRDWASMPDVPTWSPPEDAEAPQPEMSGERLCGGCGLNREVAAGPG